MSLAIALSNGALTPPAISCACVVMVIRACTTLATNASACMAEKYRNALAMGVGGGFEMYARKGDVKIVGPTFRLYTKPLGCNILS